MRIDETDADHAPLRETELGDRVRGEIPGRAADRKRPLWQVRPHG